jgi:uncharacterized membrane protein YtjA (UPF0391 family)
MPCASQRASLAQASGRRFRLVEGRAPLGATVSMREAATRESGPRGERCKVAKVNAGYTGGVIKGTNSPPIHPGSVLLGALNQSGPKPPGEPLMLHYTLVFLVIALIAGVLGFGGIAGAAAGIAKILFLVFIVLFVVSLLMGRRGRL